MWISCTWKDHIWDQGYFEYLWLRSVMRELHDTGRSAQSYLPKCLQECVAVHVHVVLKDINWEGFFGGVLFHWFVIAFCDFVFYSLFLPPTDQRIIEYTDLEGTRQDRWVQLLLPDVVAHYGKKNSRQGNVQNRIDCSEAERCKLKRDSEGRFKIR